MIATTPTKSRPTHPLVTFSAGRHITTTEMAVFWSETISRPISRPDIEKWIGGFEILPHDLRALMAVHTADPQRFMRDLGMFELAYADMRYARRKQGERGPDRRDRKIPANETIQSVATAQRVLDQYATSVRWVPAKLRRYRLGAFARFDGKSHYLTATSRTESMAIRRLATKIARALDLDMKKLEASAANVSHTLATETTSKEGQ